MVALGHVNIGAFTNNEELLGRVMAAAKAEGEKMWHMPLDDDYKELLKSAFADLANIGGRWGGADQRGVVPAGVRRRDAVGAPGHRRHRMAGRRQASHGQRPDGRLRANFHQARDGLVNPAKPLCHRRGSERARSERSA